MPGFRISRKKAEKKYSEIREQSGISETCGQIAGDTSGHGDHTETGADKPEHDRKNCSMKSQTI